jgi:signal transduction histidine kinase
LKTKLPTLGEERVNILLVDDQPQRLLSYQLVLEELGQNLISARSGVEALDLLMKHDFAVVLLDVSMPGMDGFETAAMIHDHPRYERTPIIFVTGVADTDLDRLKGYKLGAVDYVSIPVVPEILRSKVSVLVELHCQRRELQVLNRSLARANARLELAHSTLQAEKAKQLEALNETLQQANQELGRTNQALQSEIAERSRAEEALRIADRQKDEFIAILAHELRNPLAPIKSALEIMAQTRIDNERVKWSRDVIDRQIVHLTRLVDDLLDISRITRGTINLMRSEIDMGSLLARSVEAVQPIIRENHHQLTIECDDDSLVLQVDGTRIVQVLSNLLSNAAKYTRPQGAIMLRAHKNATHVEFAVKDNGVGIPSESIGRLFTLFSRLHDAPQRLHDGLGIGLALVRKIVELHGGEVSARSDGVDRGSEFVVRLPLATIATDVKSAPQSLETESAISTERRLRVLVADDNLDALESLAMLIEMAGHYALKAADGEEAVQRSLESDFDVALLDIGMPRLDGYEVARRLRARVGSDVVLVAVSGWGQSEDKRRALEAGFDLHLVKPIDFDAIEKVFAQCTRKSGQRPLAFAASGDELTPG